jgi:O-antigen/teichoic acid export membrane protein
MMDGDVRTNMGTGVDRRLLEFGKDTVVYGLMAGVSSLSGLILLPIFTRVFSVDEYGIIDMIATVTSLSSVLARLSLPGSVSRYFFEIEKGVDRERFVSTLLGCVVVVGTGLLVIGTLLSKTIAGLVLNNSQYGVFIFLGLLAAMFSALSSIPQMVLRMDRRIVQFNVLNILHSASYAGLALYLVYVQSSGLIGVFLASVVAGALQLFLAVTWTRQYMTKHFSLGHLRRSLKYSLPTVPAVLVTWINRQTDRLVLLAFIGLGGVGIFGAAARVGALVSLLTAVFTQAWVPYRMVLINAPADERDDFYRRILRYYAGFFACLGLLLTAISPEVFRILVPVEYYRGYVVIPWILGAIILHASGPITTMGILISEKTYASSIAAWCGALLNVLLALLLIPVFGIWGAAIGTFMAELSFTTILWYFTSRYSSIRFPKKSLIIVLICYMVTSISLIWLAETAQATFSLIFRALVFGGAVFLIATQTLDKQAQRFIRSAVAALPARFQDNA